jgi:hypothetical protein
LLQSGAAWVCGETAAALEDAADEIERLRAERDEAVAAVTLYRAENGCTRGQRTTQWCGEATRLRAGLMRVIQYENGCDQTGRSCDASKKCGCSLEAETWCDGGGP